MPFEANIIQELNSRGAVFVHFVDISHLSVEQNRSYPNAILFGIVLSPGYMQEVIDTPDYVQHRINNNFDFDDDEFLLTEIKTDELSDYITNLLIQKGYTAYSQSEKNQISTDCFDGLHLKTFLPHKTIAVLAGLGWIGKNNLLITPKYGSGLCLGTILTNMPLKTTTDKPILSKCGSCNLCKDICDVSALKGHSWSIGTQREDIIDVNKCTTCMKCMVCCPWTKAYIRKSKFIKDENII